MATSPTAKPAGSFSVFSSKQLAIVALEERRRDPRAILEPIEQVGRRGRLVEQIMVHHRRPDQIVRAHRREQPLKLEAVDESLTLRDGLRARRGALRGRTPTSRACRRKSTMRPISVAVLTSSARPLAASQASAIATERPAEAEGEQVGRTVLCACEPAPIASTIAVEHIIARHPCRGVLWSRVDPGDDEDRSPLIDQPFDQALTRGSRSIM